MAPVKGLRERLRDGDVTILAEGYLFAFERKGYLQAGPFTPEVVIDHPQLVRQMYLDFARAGSDVVQALTFYANRSKFSLVSRDDEVEEINRQALRIAREVADETGTLMCGDISQTGMFKAGDEKAIAQIREMMKDQVIWAVEEKADFIMGETFGDLGEAMLALDVIKEYGKGLPSVITFAPHCQRDDAGQPCTIDGVEFNEALKRLADAGADVVGFNCARGPETIIPFVERALEAGIKAPIAAIPVPYRTTYEEPTFITLTDPKYPGKRSFPLNLDNHFCNRDDIAEFGAKCAELKLNLIGLCCGNSPHLTRSLAESIGRKPPASRYSANMSLHFIFGTDDKLNKYYTKSNQDGYGKVDGVKTS